MSHFAMAIRVRLTRSRQYSDAWGTVNRDMTRQLIRLFKCML